MSAVEQGAARKAFDLTLPDLGPYSMAYTRAGRHMLLGGAKGHLAVMEWQRGHLTCEVQVRLGFRDCQGWWMLYRSRCQGSAVANLQWRPGFSGCQEVAGVSTAVPGF